MSGNNLFGNIDLGDSKPTPPAPEPIRGQTVDAEGAARATADEQAAKAAGFALRPPLYQIGTMVVKAGVENFKASRNDFDRMPGAGEALHKLAQQVKAEEREDHVVVVPEICMLENGQLAVPGNGTHLMSERAFESLCQFTTPPGGASYLSECPPALRALNINHWMPIARRLDARKTKKQGQVVEVERELTLRTRLSKDATGREVFAVTGPRYGVYNIDQLAEEILAGLEGDARAEITYDGYKVAVNVLFHSNVPATKVVAGEIFKAGMKITAADDGSGSLKFRAMVWRNLCLNLIVIDFKELLVGSRRHIGTGESITEDVRRHLKATKEHIGYFAKRWDEASVENLCERYDLAKPEDVIKGLVLNKVVWTPGVKAEEQIERLTKAWQQEPGYTKTAFINAITRMAHTETWRSWEQVEELEAKAGEMLFTREWQVKVPEKATLADL